MPAYKVLGPCFIDSVFRDIGIHDEIVTKAKIKNPPWFLEYITSSVETQKAIDNVDSKVIKSAKNHSGGVEEL